MSRLLVTVGTTRYDPLIQHVSSPDFLELAADLGIVSILIQHGTSPRPSIVAPKRLCVQTEAFISNLPDHIELSDIVIGHCGSGTVLDVLRGSIFASASADSSTRPRLILVPNDALMDGHQRELAEEIARQNWAVISIVSDLGQALQQVITSHPCPSCPLPSPSTRVLNETIRSLLQLNNS